MSRRRFPRFLWLLLTLTLVFLVWRAGAGGDKAPAGVDLQTGIVFGKGGDRELKLNMALPKQHQGKMPALVFIHGGGWSSGTKEECYFLMYPLVLQGIACATIDYRLIQEARFPAQIEDAKCAVRWMRANAEKYDIDPDRIGVFGGSAGAHLAALVATTPGKLEGSGGNPEQSSAVCAAICFAGPYDLALGFKNSANQKKQEATAIRGLLPALLGGTPEQVPDAYRDASPISQATKQTPPMLLVHGTDDSLVLVEQAEVFARKLEEVGASVKFMRLQGGTHASFGKEPQKAVAEMVAWIRQALKL